MNKNHIWLTTSLFCPCSYWNKILSKEYSSFLNLFKKGYIKKELIFLNFEQGENIRIALLINFEDYEEIRDKLDAHFTKFFSESFTDFKVNLTNKTEEFLPPLSIQYNLYKLDKTYEFDNQLNIRYSLSKIIIEGLNLEEFDEDTLITFTFYLYILTFYAIIDRVNHIVESRNQYNNISCRKIKPDEILLKKLIDNESLLIEIAKEIQFEKNQYKEILWLKKWKLLCESRIHKEFDNKTIERMKNNYNIFYVFNELYTILNDHLGLSESVALSILEVAERVIRQTYPNKANLSKISPFTNNIIFNEGIDYDYFNTESLIKKIDHKPIPIGKDEIRLFVIARNEELRLPHFLEYYENLGIDRFFIIDNGSTDNTTKIALNCENAHIFEVDDNYRNHWYWMEHMLEIYGKDQWCIVVDVDELLAFPYYEKISLKSVINYFEKNNFTAMSSVLLDMHSDKPIVETLYHQGQNPLKSCPYLNPNITFKNYKFYDRKNKEHFSTRCHAGGVRNNVFGSRDSEKGLVCLTKISVFKYLKKTFLAQGMHAINNANFSDIEGVVFHTKFLNDFIERTYEESSREEHFNNAAEYKIYKSKLNLYNKLSLFSEDSVSLKDSKQLIDLKLMKITKNYLNYFNR